LEGKPGTGETVASALAQGLQGYIAGREMKRKRELEEAEERRREAMGPIERALMEATTKQRQVEQEMLGGLSQEDRDKAMRIRMGLEARPEPEPTGIDRIIAEHRTKLLQDEPIFNKINKYVQMANVAARTFKFSLANSYLKQAENLMTQLRDKESRDAAKQIIETQKETIQQPSKGTPMQKPTPSKSDPLGIR